VLAELQLFGENVIFAEFFSIGRPAHIVFFSILWPLKEFLLVDRPRERIPLGSPEVNVRFFMFLNHEK
jgi:hypothetical protein